MNDKKVIKHTTKLDNRNNVVQQFITPLNKFRSALADIRPLLEKLTPEQRSKIELKDTVLQLARTIYEELGDLFR